MLLHNVDIGAPQVILLLSYFTHTGASSSNYATIGAFGAVDRIADELARIEAAKAMDAPVDQSDIYRRPDYSGALETLLVALKGRGSFGVGGRSVGSADFFASLVPQDKQEQELRSWTVRDPASVHVVEEHNHALKWWIRAVHGSLERYASVSHGAVTHGCKHGEGWGCLRRHVPAESQLQKRRVLLHVDSHSDIGVVPWDGFQQNAFLMGRVGVAKSMVQNMNIGNFVAAGSMASIFTDMVWLRSNFPGCSYNGPEQGHHLVGLFSSNDGTVCQRIIKSSTTKNQRIRDESIGITVTRFDTCTDEALPLHSSPLATFNLLVTTLSDFVQDLPLILTGNDKAYEWILDVDEDFFASLMPGWHVFNHYLKDLSATQMWHVRDFLNQLGQDCFTESPDSMQIFEHMLDDGVQRSGISLACNVSAELWQKLSLLRARLSYKEQTQWRNAWHYLISNDHLADGLSVLIGETEMPEGVPTLPQLQSTLQSFQHSIGMIAKKLGKPKVITLCRSLLNGYLPKRLWPQIEKGVQTALKTAMQVPSLTLNVDTDHLRSMPI